MGNVPPESGIRVPAGDLRRLVQSLFERVGMSTAHASTMAELLVITDLRGVVSHGTFQTAGYCRMILDGRVNPTPGIESGPGVDDGADPRRRRRHGPPALQAGGGVGGRARPRARGGRGHHEQPLPLRGGRQVLAHGRRPRLHRDRRILPPLPFPLPGSILGIKGSSPISIALPAGEQPPMVLDMGSSFLPYDDELFERAPFAYFKEMGIAASAYGLGGVLAGIYKPEFIPPASRWESNQGSFIAAFSVESFMDPDEYKAEMDRWIGEARALDPLPGYDSAELPGGLEWRREREYAREGIPVGDETRSSLEEIAAELDVETPFTRYLHTRFGGEDMIDRVLGTCAIEFRGREPARRLVEEAGFEFVHRQGSAPWRDEETREKLAGFRGILAGGEYFTPHTMELGRRPQGDRPQRSRLRPRRPPPLHRTGHRGHQHSGSHVGRGGRPRHGPAAGRGAPHRPRGPDGEVPAATRSRSPRTCAP